MSYEALPQTQLSEDVHHDLHGCVVGHGERAHVKNAAKLQGPGALCRKRRGVLRKTHSGTAHDSFLLFSCTF